MTTRTATLLVLLCAMALTACANSKSANIPPEVSDQMLEQEVQTALRQQAAVPTEDKAALVLAHQEQFKKGSIAPGMKISLDAIEDENLKGTFQVSFDGMLSLPYGVKVKAAGLTPPELRAQLQKSYAPYFRFSPSIRVDLADSRQMVEVQGLVKKPGKILVMREATLDEIISQGGGLSAPADVGGSPKYVRVIPAQGESFAVGLRDYYAGVSPVSFRWTGGDRVFFQSEEPEDLLAGNTIGRESVQLLGQIRTPGAYPFKQQESFFHYLVIAGGPTEKTDFKKVEVVRMEDGRRKSKVYDLTKKEVLPHIIGGDIVIVHAQQTDTTIPNATSVLSSIATALLAAIAI